MKNFKFGDWNHTDKDDLNTYTALLNVLIHWYNSDIKQLDIENCKVDFVIDKNRMKNDGFLNSNFSEYIRG